MKKHSCTRAKVALDLGRELSFCPGATIRVLVGEKELFVTGVALEETEALGGRQRVWTLSLEGVD